MLVNIIVRTFRGRELLLARALESIRAQQTGHEIRVIVAIDGKPIDEQRAGLSASEQASIVYAAAPGGRSAAANAGLDATTGDAIGFLDDDDWLEPEHVECLARLLDNNLGAAAAYAPAWEQEANINVQDPAKSEYGRKRRFFRKTRNSLDLVNTNLFPIQAVLFRRSVLLSSGARFSTVLDALEDWLFWQHLLVGEAIVSTSQVTSTFLMPMDKIVQERRADAHRDALPKMLALRQSVRVPIAVADELMRTRYEEPPPQPAKKAPQATLNNLLTARLSLLSHHRPKLRHKAEYFLLRAARKLRRSFGTGKAEALKAKERERAKRAHEKQSLRRRRQRANAMPAVSVPASISTLQPRFEKSSTAYSRTADIAVFTSCNWAYMDKALVLAESVARHMPNADFHILLVDTPREGKQLPPTVSRLFRCSDLPDFKAGWVFKHNVVEISTAVKPLYTDVLLDEGYQQVVYFDPDTMLLSTPLSLERDLQRGDFLLTPHLHRPAVTKLATESFEISAMAHGIYNLGFFALNNTPAARQVVSYWAERCRSYSFGEVHLGVFTDQKWANHFPVFFPDTIVVSANPGLNAAVWNAEGRALVRRNETYHIDGVPIEMFHFSGWDSGIPERFGQEFLGSASGADFLALYGEAVARYADLRDRFWPYAYYDDGVKIEEPHRILYRRDVSMQQAYPDPFKSGPHTFQSYVTENHDAVFERFDESKIIRRHF